MIRDHCWTGCECPRCKPMSEHPHHAVELRTLADELEGVESDMTAAGLMTDARTVRRVATRLNELSALTAQQTATAGWRLVPVEPVREMVEAAAREFGAGASTHFQIKAAIAAAPQQTATAVSREALADVIYRGAMTYATALERADVVLSLLRGGEGLGSRAVPCQEHQPEQGLASREDIARALSEHDWRGTQVWERKPQSYRNEYLARADAVLALLGGGEGLARAEAGR